MSQGALSSDTQAMLAFEAGKKSAGVAYLLWFFTGGVGGHRFYIGETGSAVGQLLLCIVGIATSFFGIGLVFLGILGIWLLIDLFTIGGMVQHRNNLLLARLNQGVTSTESVVDELTKFASLRDSGAITAEEYEEQKRRLIGGSISPSANSEAVQA